ncbi:hypothetical protein ACFL4F_02945 [Candidatus Margulisiibacteriota bacterium]
MPEILSIDESNCDAYKGLLEWDIDNNGRLSHFASNTRKIILILKENSLGVSYLVYSNDGMSIDLEYIATNTDYKRRGYATALINELKKRFPSKDISAIPRAPYMKEVLSKWGFAESKNPGMSNDNPIWKFRGK